MGRHLRRVARSTGDVGRFLARTGQWWWVLVVVLLAVATAAIAAAKAATPTLVYTLF